MRNTLIAVIIALGVVLMGCSKQPKVCKIISGKIIAIHGKYSRANDFKIDVDTSGGVINTTSDNTFWDFDGAVCGDSALVRIYTDGSACAHTYHTRSMMVAENDREVIVGLGVNGRTQ